MSSVSLFYLVGLFDLWSGIRTLAISAVGAYVIASYVKGSFMPWIGFAFLMGHMSVNHIYRQLANTPQEVDITGQFWHLQGRQAEIGDRCTNGSCNEGKIETSQDDIIF